MRLLVAVFVLLCATRVAEAGPKEEFESARQNVLTGECEKAIGQLTSLLYPTPRLTDRPSLSQAHMMLGACYFETGNVAGAEREFEEAIALEPTNVLSTTVASPNAVAFFDKTKAAIAQRAKDIAEKERLAKREKALQKALDNMLVYEKRRMWVNFAPLGAGQFQNGDSEKGRNFFIGQTLTGGLSLGIFAYQVAEYGLGGSVPRDDVDTVNLLQQIQIGSGIAFFGLWGWSIVDSLSNFEYTVQRKADPSLIRELEDALTPTSPTTSFQVIPVLGPDSGSVSLHWEF